MPIIHEQLIDEIEGHIRKFGGGFGEWCMGTAQDSRGPFFRRHLAADLGDGLTYREAFTTSAAQAVVAHMVNDRGLELDDGAVPEPGKIVFVYKRGVEGSSPQTPVRAQPATHKRHLAVGQSAA